MILTGLVNPSVFIKYQVFIFQCHIIPLSQTWAGQAFYLRSLDGFKRVRPSAYRAELAACSPEFVWVGGHESSRVENSSPFIYSFILIRFFVSCLSPLQYPVLWLSVTGVYPAVGKLAVGLGWVATRHVYSSGLHSDASRIKLLKCIFPPISKSIMLVCESHQNLLKF